LLNGITDVNQSSGEGRIVRITQLRGAIALLAAAGALGSVATTASAHQFTGSTSEEVRAEGVGTQEFAFKPFTIACEAAKSVKTEDDVTFPSPALYLAVKYSHCLTKNAKFHKVELPPVKTTFITPVDYELHANGFVETGAESESTSSVENAGAVEISMKGAFKCIISWAPQTVPVKAIKKPAEQFESALFEKDEETTENLKRFPLGVQDKLLIKSDLKRMTFELSEGICEEFESTEGKTGSYAGTLRAELRKGNLGWE
jgi:hypothetical protein